MRTLFRAGIVAGLAVLGLVGTAAPALAADPVAELKTSVTNRIDLRLTALSRDLTDINAARNLADGHRSALSTVVNNDVAGLTALRGKVAGETTVAGLHDDATSMVNDYRVYTLAGPQLRLTIAGDLESVAIGTVQQAHDKLAQLVANAKAGGTDTSTAEADLADMHASIDSATGHVAGQVDTLLGVEPGPDLAPIKNSVDTTRIALGAARIDLRNAATSGRAVLAALKAA